MSRVDFQTVYIYNIPRTAGDTY